MMSRLSLKAATSFSTAIWAFAPVQSFMTLLLHDSFQLKADMGILRLGRKAELRCMGNQFPL